MVIYLKHPVHGMKVAISDLEAEYDKKNGWEIFDPEEKINLKVEKQEVKSVTSPKVRPYIHRHKNT